jgi:uncharacterized membrane protein YsdA (DUF1294 family)
MPSVNRSRVGQFVVLGAVLFLTALGALGLLGAMPMEIFYLYIGASILTFATYAMDKSAAIKGRYRTPENILHFLAIVGGWPGALVAQQKFRHKTKKQPFRAIFWFTVILNCGVLAWTFSPPGSAVVQSLSEYLTSEEGSNLGAGDTPIIIHGGQ